MTTLRENTLSWLGWEKAPLIEVGTAGGQRFIGIVEEATDEDVLGLDQYDSQYVVVPWSQITYAMPVSLDGRDAWPAWARAQANRRREDLRSTPQPNRD